MSKYGIKNNNLHKTQIIDWIIHKKEEASLVILRDIV